MSTLTQRKSRAKSLAKLLCKVQDVYGLDNQGVVDALKLDVHSTTISNWRLGKTSPQDDNTYNSVMADLKYLLKRLKDQKPDIPDIPTPVVVSPEPEPEQQELPFTSALSVQVGGSHYKDSSIQPVQYIQANDLGFLEGCIVKRVSRHDKPTGKGREDLEKVIHEAQLLLELQYGVSP
jgi:hypothetical protein